ncbi:hypothetical protein N7453_008371 [Penicillium expansum]|nr:hypothetical protein N7453_008371 [Penicillium expansum]
MNIDERPFIECFLDSGESLLRLSWDIYDHTSQSNILEVGSQPHAVAVAALDEVVSTWTRIDESPSILPTGRRGFRGQKITKKPDNSWRPIKATGQELNK